MSLFTASRKSCSLLILTAINFQGKSGWCAFVKSEYDASAIEHTY